MATLADTAADLAALKATVADQRVLIDTLSETVSTQNERISALESGAQNFAADMVDTKSLAQTATDALAETDARVSELATALGSSDGQFAGKEEVNELRGALNELSSRMTTVITIPGSGSADDLSGPREGFPQGLVSYVFSTYYGREYLRWLQAQPINPPSE